ncbi:glucoside xylosyltransferase 1-like isoform X2 [Dermacentor silvarum]|uniref:glucoside xylosyltransferase 1-like isoform X2 n=1 Tax=Dermacentor silvarum TaxID=543639 RepID=UPI002101ACB1|nr:glucoside xylosyltransferase 1-like isoform X2 [Dermacentor silvarum]
MTSHEAKIVGPRRALVMLGAILFVTVWLSASRLNYARVRLSLRSSFANRSRLVADFLLGEANERRAATGNVTGGNEDGAPYEKYRMTLVFVICGNDYPLGRIAIRSAVAYSTTPLQIIVIADKENEGKVLKEFGTWPENVKRRVRLHVRPPSTPDDSREGKATAIKKCASQALQLPEMFPHLDAAIYVDVAMVFVEVVEDMWRLFALLNEHQFALMAPESESAHNRYRKQKKHPFFWPYGVRSDMMMMNLTRMRKFGFKWRVQKTRWQFASIGVHRDQDLLNILFHEYVETVSLLNCRWNYRPEHCRRTAICAVLPPALLHDPSRSNGTASEPSFAAVYKAMQTYQLGEGLLEGFIGPLNATLRHTNTTNVAGSSRTSCSCGSSRLAEWTTSATPERSATPPST